MNLRTFAPVLSLAVFCLLGCSNTHSVRRAYDRARAENRIPTYEAFLERYPGTEFTEEVEDRLALLRARKAATAEVSALNKSDRPDDLERLLGFLEHKDWAVRHAAAEAIGTRPKWPPAWNRDRAEEALAARLDDPNERVRARTARSLGRLGGARATEVLTAALDREDMFIVSNAFRFFIRFGRPGSEEFLIRVLNEGGGPVIAEHCLNSGNPKLAKAGALWCREHGYHIHSWPGVGSPDWGSARK